MSLQAILLLMFHYLYFWSRDMDIRDNTQSQL